MKPQDTGTGALFRTPLLEKLTRTHISLPLIIFYTSAILVIVFSILRWGITFGNALVYFGAGVFTFTLIEYLFHRYLFHMVADTPAKEKFTYTFHGIHHDYPRDKDRLAMPPIVSVLLAASIVGIFRLAFGIPGFTIGAGILFGYASYLLVHYSVHALRPPKNFLKYLWKHHAIHHYKDHHSAFGVSSPFWDYVFNTMPKKDPNCQE